MKMYEVRFRDPIKFDNRVSSLVLRDVKQQKDMHCCQGRFGQLLAHADPHVYDQRAYC